MTNQANKTANSKRLAAQKTKPTLIDNMDFSDIAKQMATLKSALFDTTETTQSKIEFIKEELAAKRYQIQSEHIAARLLEYAESQAELEPA